MHPPVRSDFRALFLQPQAVLSLFISNQCNFFCKHCCTGSGPEKTPQIDDELLGKILAQSERRKEIRAIHVSGGEPFLQLRALIKLSRHAERTRVLLGVNTNGFWIRSSRLRRALTEELAGITHLFISFSQWHAQFISPEEIGDAVQFAIAAGRSVDLVLICERQLEESDELLAAIFPHRTPEGLNVATGFVEPVGRAERFENLPLVQGKVYSRVPGIAPEPCELVNRPTVMDDGAYLMCCNTVNYRKGSSGLRMGSAKTESLDDLMSRHTGDPVVWALRALGPRFLLELNDRILGTCDTPQMSSQLGKCAECHLLMQDAQKLARVRQKLALVRETLAGTERQ
jgi:hypothetical protein